MYSTHRGLENIALSIPLLLEEIFYPSEVRPSPICKQVGLQCEETGVFALSFHVDVPKMFTKNIIVPARPLKRCICSCLHLITTGFYANILKLRRRSILAELLVKHKPIEL